MSAIGLLLAGGVGALCLVILLIFLRKGIRVEKDAWRSAEPGRVGDLYQAVENELAKLHMTRERLKQTSQNLSHLVDQEIHKKSKNLDAEIRNTYQNVIQEKDKEVKTVRDLFNDVTRKFEKLGKEKKQTESVVRSLADGLIVVDENGQTLHINPVAEKILGKKKEEVLGRPISSVQGHDRVIAFINRVEASEEEALSLMSQDVETQKILGESTAVIESETGQTRGMISALPDVTKIRELDEAKNEFIANVSHELKAPLICIQKSLSALLAEDLGQMAAEQKKFVEMAHRNSLRLEKIISQILDFSKWEAGQMLLQTGLFQISTVVIDSTEQFRIWAGQKNIQLQIQHEDPTLMMDADKEKIIQVLTNLIGNAVKFTPKKGIIRIETRIHRQTDDLAPQGGNSIEFAVQDNGPGITVKDQERLFKKFGRATSIPLADDQGTGLGLCISKQIIEKHGGHIRVDSGAGQGSRFIFVIPQYQPSH